MSLTCCFDTETTNLVDWKRADDYPGQPNITQLAAILSDENQIYAELKCIINPVDVHEAWVMGEGAASVHGITREIVEAAGIPTQTACRMLVHMMEQAETVVCHNVDFDKKLLQIALVRGKQEAALNRVLALKYYCTMKKSTDLCKIPGQYAGKYKWPRLLELHKFLFGEEFEGAHDALNDVRATARCYYELKRRGL